MREYTEQDRLELGIEIVAAMKANVYKVPIEDGRDMALEETELDRMGHSAAALESMDPSQLERLRAFAARRKEELNQQAMFVADAAIAYMRSHEMLHS